MPPTLRILDANANRAREALRVMEEAARFILNHSELAGQLKHLRHDLADALRPLPDLLYHRDTPGDVGTSISVSNEGERGSATQVASAAGKRLTEALRAIEEYGKLHRAMPGAAQLPERIEQLRYRAYELELKLGRAMGAGEVRQWRLCLLLTEALCRASWQDVLDAALRGGADCIQIREKQMDAGPLRDRVAAVVQQARGRASIIVNDRPDIALATGAHGVHLGQTDLCPRDVRKLAGQQLIIGVSTSTIDQARRARDDGADYCGVGPMYPTKTKRKDTLAGPDYLRTYLKWNKLPHLAIGGIDAGNTDALRRLGCQGVAVSSAICAADDPYATTRAIITHLPGPIASHV
ncbi:MAG: thiamine phosphate synthase [Phycisphaerales bacterium JB063]